MKEGFLAPLLTNREIYCGSDPDKLALTFSLQGVRLTGDAHERSSGAGLAQKGLPCRACMFLHVMAGWRNN